MSGAMNGYYLEEQLLQARDLLLHISMMSGKNVRNQVNERGIVEVVLRSGFGGGRSPVFKTAQHLLDRDIGLPAGILERPTSSAAIVNAELLKNAGCVG